MKGLLQELVMGLCTLVAELGARKMGRTALQQKQAHDKVIEE